MSNPTAKTNNPSGNDVRHDYTGNSIDTKEKTEVVHAIYADLAGRIDQFLSEENPNPVRRGTQLKVGESLEVIQKALQDYGYSSMKIP